MTSLIFPKERECLVSRLTIISMFPARVPHSKENRILLVGLLLFFVALVTAILLLVCEGLSTFYKRQVRTPSHRQFQQWVEELTHLLTGGSTSLVMVSIGRN